MTNERTTKSKMTKAEAIKLVVSVGLSIEILYEGSLASTSREHVYSAAIRFAKLSRVVLHERANSDKFRQSFGELRRLNVQLKENRTLPK